MPALRLEEILNPAADPVQLCDSSPSPSSSIWVQEIGVSVFECQHVLVIIYQPSFCVLTSASELRMLKKEEEKKKLVF